jgi:nitric oxide reductase activation protein
LESVHHRHGALLARVRRQFQHIKPESTKRVRKVSDGEEIDLDRAVEAHTDIRAGLAPSERVYMRRDRARREVAAAFLVDLSASVREPVPEPEDESQNPPVVESHDRHLLGVRSSLMDHDEQRRRVLDIQKEALALMVQALEALGDEYGIYGFSGENRENVEFYVAKELGDRLSVQVWNAISAMRSRRYTRMGTAIRHTIRKLERQDARRKVMLLISDGYPQDIDYGPDRDDRDYGIHDTAQALREAELARIQTFCVTIDRAGHDYLRKMCPEGRYLILDEVESLPAELGKVYRSLTRS